MNTLAKRHILLTGVTGLVGRHVLYELLLENISGATNNRIYVTIRDGDVPPEERLKNLFKQGACPANLLTTPIEELLSYIHVVSLDLLDDNLQTSLERILPNDCILIHSAATTNLANNEAASQDVQDNNIRATERLLAASKNRVTKVCYISSSFAIGHMAGIIDDDYLGREAGDSRNPYEKFKLHAEQSLVAYCKQHKLDWQILRPSIVCGRLLQKPYFYTSKFDVFYGFAKCFAYLAAKKKGGGDIRILCNKDSSLNIVPADYAAKVICKAISTPVKQLNIVHKHSVPTRTLVSAVMQSVGFDRYRFTDEIPQDQNKEERFYYATAGAIFSGYLASPPQSFDVRRIEVLMNGLTPPSISQALPDLLNYAVQCQFDPGNTENVAAMSVAASSQPKRIVLLGAGYVGYYTYKTLRKTLRKAIHNKEIEIVVISNSHNHVFHGFVGEVIAGVLTQDCILAPVRELFPQSRLIKGKVTKIERSTQSLQYLDEDGQMSKLQYDELVVAPGSINGSANVPGLNRHGLSVRNQHLLEELQHHIVRMLELAQSSNDKHIIQSALTFCVIGAGFTGVEMCTAIAHFLNVCKKHYPVLRIHDPKLLLIHSGPDILPELQSFQTLLRYTRKQLSAYGIRTVLNTRVVSVEKNRVLFNNGSSIDCHSILSTVGHTPVILDGLTDCPTDALGRLCGNEFLNLNGSTNIWIGGDNASIPRAGKSEACPTNALWAIKHGQHIARNMARKIHNKPLKPFTFKGLGQAASLGDFKGLSELYGIQITGWLAKVSRLGFFLYYMPSKRNAVKVLTELSLNLLFGNKLPKGRDLSDRPLAGHNTHTVVELHTDTSVDAASPNSLRSHQGI